MQAWVKEIWCRRWKIPKHDTCKWPSYSYHRSGAPTKTSRIADNIWTQTLCRSAYSSGPQFYIKMTSYQYRKSHCGDKTIVRPSYLHNGISYTGKTTALYWIGTQITRSHWLIKCLFTNLFRLSTEETSDFRFSCFWRNHWGLVDSSHRDPVMWK